MIAVRHAGAMVVAIISATLLALALAPLGTTPLYVIVGLISVGVLGYALRADLAPPWQAAVARIAPPHRRRAAPSWRRRTAVAAVVIVGLPLTAFVLADLGTKGIAAFGGAVALAVLAWLFWPLLTDLVRSPATDVAPRRRRGLRIPVLSSRASAVLVAGVVVAVVGASFVLAGLGAKGVVAAVGLVAVAVLLVVVRDRSVFFTFAATASLAVVLHKSFGPQDLEQSGGAVAVYITTFDAMIVLLFGLWAHEGTLRADLRAVRTNRLLWAPLLGAVGMVPSVLVAPSIGHVAGEVVRMAWMFLLFLYLAVRVRTRRHVVAVLGGLGVLAGIEFVVVVLQWRTGGVLGLSFLGVPTQLTQRVTDVSAIGRPFGTIIHPVFMGAVMGSLALLALALAVNLPRSTGRIIAAVMVVVCSVPLYLSHTRASAVAVALTGVWVVLLGLRARRIAWSTVGRFALAGLAAGLVFAPQLIDKFSENFGTSHFWEEVQSRLQLNGIALNMIDDHWGLGIGLNNFETVLPRYEPHFVIFFGNPVHNLYLLQFAETGVLGLAGLLVVGVVFLVAAWRLSRSADRLYAGIGVGVTATIVFLAVEELLGFSLRQDIPLALFWLLAGLVVACRRLAGPVPAPRGPGRTAPSRASQPTRTARMTRQERRAAAAGSQARHPSAGRTLMLRVAERVRRRRTVRLRPLPRLLARLRPVGRRAAVRATCLTLVAATAAAAQLATSTPTHADGPPMSSQAAPVTDRIVFQATVRATGREALFTAAADGSGLRRITPVDDRDYRWGRWAFGGRAIVYTVRTGAAGSAEAIEMVDPDGRNRRRIAEFDFQVAQPQVDASGRWLYFTAAAPWFPQVAVFRMDLQTLESTNLTAVTTPAAGIDADPVLTDDGRHVVLVAGSSDRADITQIDDDGNDRRAITHDNFFNTDPDLSPDGNTVVTSSYRGPDSPDRGGLVARTSDFRIVLHPTAGGDERLLTDGQNCAARLVDQPCLVSQMSAYVPRFSGDGTRVAFTGALDRATTCICAIGVDGSDGRAIIASTALGIDWFDLPPRHDMDAAVAGAAMAAVGSQQRRSRLLVVSAPTAGGHPQLVQASPDLMHRLVIPLPDDLVPQQARWSPDRTQIVFTADVAVPTTPAAPHPAAPPGVARHEHVTLADLDPIGVAAQAQLQADGPPTHLSQVFLRRADGTVTALTDPWIEDSQDGVREGDARSNTDPAFTPDGRAVLVTNTSTLTGESFVLRIDLASGAVLNLTNATSGAVPVADLAPSVSPDGTRVAFAWTNGVVSDVYTMDAATGADVRPVTVTDAADGSPRWWPDGGSVVSVEADPQGAVVVRTDLAGRRTVLSGAAQSPAAAPVVAPEGDRVLFIGAALQTSGVYAAAPAGGAAAPLQPDPLHVYYDLDWR